MSFSRDKITIFSNRQAAEMKKNINLFTVPMEYRKEIVELHRHAKKHLLFNGMISEALEEITYKAVVSDIRSLQEQMREALSGMMQVQHNLP